MGSIESRGWRKPTAGTYRVEIVSLHTPTGRMIRDPDSGEWMDEISTVVLSPPDSNSGWLITIDSWGGRNLTICMATMRLRSWQVLMVWIILVSGQ